MIIPDEIKELIHKYIEKNGKRPLGFNYDEWNSFAEYKEYLEKELEKQHLLKIVGALIIKEQRKYSKTKRKCEKVYYINRKRSKRWNNR